VRRAIGNGRLRESIVTVNGMPKIRDVATADAEWHANTRLTVANMGPAVPPAVPPVMGDLEPVARGVPDLQESRARLEAARADLAELELAERRGKLVPADEIAAKYESVVMEAKTKLLGIPTRAKQTLPHLTAEDVLKLDALVREALEGLADGG
jgi:hypothetical protein